MKKSGLAGLVLAGAMAASVYASDAEHLLWRGQIDGNRIQKVEIGLRDMKMTDLMVEKPGDYGVDFYLGFQDFDGDNVVDMIYMGFPDGKEGAGRDSYGEVYLFRKDDRPMVQGMFRQFEPMYSEIEKMMKATPEDRSVKMEHFMNFPRHDKE